MPASVEVLRNPNPGFCRTCGDPVKSPRQYCDEHRPAKPERTPQQRGKDRLQRSTAKEGPRKVVTDIAQAASGRMKKTTVDQTTRVLGKIVMYLTLFLVMRLVSDDPELPTEEMQEEMVGELQLHEEDARTLVHPFARLLNPTNIWQKYGSTLVDNSDVLDALSVAYDFGSGLARYQRRRNRAAIGRRNAPSNGHVASRPTEPLIPVNEAVPEAVPPEWGSQVGPTAEQIEQFRRAREAQQ